MPVINKQFVFVKRDARPNSHILVMTLYGSEVREHN